MADQLTPEQIAELENWEQRWPDEHKGFLLEARSYAEQNLDTKLMFGGVDAPDGAALVYPAAQRQDGCWCREFIGTSRTVAGVSVLIEGEQYPDGSVKRVLTISVDDLPMSRGGGLSVDEARQLAAQLVQAAAELDRLQ